VNAIRANQRVTRLDRHSPTGMTIHEDSLDLVGVVFERLKVMAGTYELGAEPGSNLIEQHHLQSSAVKGILRLRVSGIAPSRLPPDHLSVFAEVDEFGRWHANGSQLGLDLELREYPHGVGQKIDSNSDRRNVMHRLEYSDFRSNAVQCERGSQAPDSTTGNENPPLSWHLASRADTHARTKS
jgi:hypothetical protein